MFKPQRPGGDRRKLRFRPTRWLAGQGRCDGALGKKLRFMAPTQTRVGGADPRGGLHRSRGRGTWTVRATAYGPSTSTTWNLPVSAVVFVRWGSNPGQPYIGTAPTSWARMSRPVSARRSSARLRTRQAGPLAQLLAVPQDGGDGGEDDPLAALKADIAGARGKASLGARSTKSPSFSVRRGLASPRLRETGLPKISTSGTATPLTWARGPRSRPNSSPEKLCANCRS